MHRARLLGVSAAVALPFALPAAPVQLKLKPTAVVSPAGVVTGDVRVKCPRGAQVLEALVTLSQDDQALFGQGSISGVTCTGRREWHQYRVAAPEAQFHRGEANASAYLLLTDGTSGGDTRTVRVRQR